MEDTFDRFWNSYPKRLGCNPKKPARDKFARKVKSGVDPEAMIAGAMAYRQELERENKIGTPYVAHAQTWLNQHRWEDYVVVVQFTPAPELQHLRERYGSGRIAE